MDYHWLEQTHKAIFGSGLTYSGIGAPERYIRSTHTSIHTPYIHTYTYRQIESDSTTQHSTGIYICICICICMYIYVYMYKHYRQWISYLVGQWMSQTLNSCQCTIYTTPSTPLTSLTTASQRSFFFSSILLLLLPLFTSSFLFHFFFILSPLLSHPSLSSRI